MSGGGLEKRGGLGENSRTNSRRGGNVIRELGGLYRKGTEVVCGRVYTCLCMWYDVGELRNHFDELAV